MRHKNNNKTSHPAVLPDSTPALFLPDYTLIFAFSN